MSTRDELRSAFYRDEFWDAGEVVDVFSPERAANILHAEGWRKMPSRKMLLDTLYEPDNRANNEKEFAGRALAQRQAEAIVDAILALMDGGQ